MLTPTQKQTAQSIVNLFETGVVLGDYGSVTVIPGDTGHLTFGRSQTTLGSGNLLDLLQRYCANDGGRFSHRLARWLPRFEASDFALDSELRLHNLLRADRAAAAGLQAMLFKSGPATTFPLEAGGYIKSRPDLDAPDLQRQFLPGLTAATLRLPFLINPKKPQGHGFFANIFVMRPESRGALTLRGANPDDPPKIDPNYLSDERDIATTREGFRRLREIFAQAPFDGYRGAELTPGSAVESDAAIDAYVRRAADTVFHPAGTCKMGVGGDAVVDGQGSRSQCSRSPARPGSGSMPWCARQRSVHRPWYWPPSRWWQRHRLVRCGPPRLGWPPAGSSPRARRGRAGCGSTRPVPRRHPRPWDGRRGPELSRWPPGRRARSARGCHACWARAPRHERAGRRHGWRCRQRMPSRR